MTSYKEWRSQGISDTGFHAGSIITQQAFQNVTQDDTVSVTHSEDLITLRSVQIIEFKPESESTVNTSLDFDLADESDFVQEDSVSGTRFVNGQISLQPVWGSTGNFQEQQKIMSSDIDPEGRLGSSVAIYGDTAVVGARYEDTGATNIGSAYVFTRTGSTWIQQQEIKASDMQSGDQFGTSVSIHADTVVVGAFLEGTGSIHTGAAYIFTRSGSTWVEQQKIQASDKEDNDRFGYSTAIYGETIIVGAYSEDPDGTIDSGSAYIFTKAGSTWTEQQKIQASDKEVGDGFGLAVSLHQDTAIIGAHLEDTGATNAGAAYIFTRSGSTWTEQQKIQASDKQAGDLFGTSVALYANTSVVGAHNEDTGGLSAGKVYIFTRSDSTWTEQQKIQASDPEAGDWFGRSVSIYEDTSIVGAYGEDTVASNTGAVYIFTRSGSTWTQQQKIQASDKEENDQFGYAVALHQDTAIVGARYEDTGGTDAGASYIFSRATFPTTPYYVTTSGSNHILLTDVSQINGCVVTNTTPTNTSIKCLASFDDRATWDKWSGSSWTTHSGGLTNLQTGNTITELQSGFINLTIASGTDYLDFAFDLGTTSNLVSPAIDAISVDYDEEGYYQLLDMGSDYETSSYSTTQTSVTKKSQGGKNIKINVLI